MTARLARFRSHQRDSPAILGVAVTDTPEDAIQICTRLRGRGGSEGHERSGTSCALGSPQFELHTFPLFSRGRQIRENLPHPSDAFRTKPLSPPRSPPLGLFLVRFQARERALCYALVSIDIFHLDLKEYIRPPYAEWGGLVRRLFFGKVELFYTA